MLIDQELQYASQWYLRDDLVEPTFICLKDNEKKNNFCNPISKKPSEQFVLLDEIIVTNIVAKTIAHAFPTVRMIFLCYSLCIVTDKFSQIINDTTYYKDNRNIPMRNYSLS